MTMTLPYTPKHPDILRQEISTLEKLNYALRQVLIQALESEGYYISGPSDSRASEEGEPKWVFNARAAIAEATQP